MTFAIRRERTTTNWVVSLIGELDSGTADAVVQAITSTTGTSVVVDLSDLDSLDGSGLLALVEASHHLASSGKELTIVNASGEVMTAIRSSTLEPFIAGIGPRAAPR